MRIVIQAVGFFLLHLRFLSADGAAYDPVALYLTWQSSPETTMTVQWITTPERTQSRVEYRKKGEEGWLGIMGSNRPMPQGLPYLIHVVEITGLNPNTAYEFRTGSDSVIYFFRTMPSSLNGPFSFIAGGDIYHDSLDFLKATNQAAAKLDPLFAIVGGDLAYGDKKVFFWGDNKGRWLEWLKSWKEDMVASDGRLIPMLPAIGNHDTNGRFNQSPDKAPFFYSLFAFPGIQGYNVLDFGNYLSLFHLDSNHTHPIEGLQSLWLYEKLEERHQRPHKFAVYHVASYPSVKKFNGDVCTKIRAHWHPIFDRFGLHAAFENHDHAYKRTPPIRGGKVVSDGDGTLYIGDGAWGVRKPRKTRSPSSTWYLAKAESKRHVIEITLYPNGSRRFRAVDDGGMVFDEKIVAGSQRSP